MVPRLDDEGQKKIDEAWEKALSPLDRLDHQKLLDALIGTNAYQLGVDKLYFRSEKRYSGGKVVMEVHFDRATPEEDRFEVNVLDADGKVLRREHYGREDVEKTYRELFVDTPPTLKKGEQETPEAAERRVKYEARWEQILQVFPEPKAKDK
jgi:hypothetical protein